MEKLNNLSLEKLFENFISEGIESGEFNKDLNKENTLLLLLSLFFSPAITKFVNNSIDLRKFFDDALKSIFHNV